MRGEMRTGRTGRTCRTCRTFLQPITAAEIWDVVVVVAWLAVLDGRFFSKIFACRRVEPEGAGSSPARPTNKLKVES